MGVYAVDCVYVGEAEFEAVLGAETKEVSVMMVQAEGHALRAHDSYQVPFRAQQSQLVLMDLDSHSCSTEDLKYHPWTQL